jgi:predicted metal-dependent hydrolase
MKAEADEKLFLQALIQVAAACVHFGRGNGKPGIRLLALAEEKLKGLGGNFGEINTDFLRKAIGEAAERVGRGDSPGDAAKAIRL